MFIDGVYVRLITPDASTDSNMPQVPPKLFPGEYPLQHPFFSSVNSKLWMFDVTLQGNGDQVTDCEYCGFGSFGSSIYAEGVIC